MACTLGMDAERRLRTTGAQHPLEGAVLDAACSAYVEAAVEQMDQQVKTDAAAHGLAGNWRFSPGYGDCPLSAQRSIVNALNATRLIGLTVTPTSLLMPTKSVTAVIGLFDGEVHDAQTRPTCNISPHARELPLPRRPHHLLFQPLGAPDVYSAYHS